RAPDRPCRRTGLRSRRERTPGARSIFFLARRKLHSRDEWNAWFESIAAPTPLNDWAEAFESERGLRKRHNTAAFLQSLYLYVREDGAEIHDRVFDALLAAIKRVP